MPTLNNLTDSQCRSAKPGPKPRKMFDGGGLHLYVSPTGSKTWRLAYRFEGKPQTLSFGPYPEVSLAEARKRRDDAKAKLRDRINPSEHRKPSRQQNISSLTWGLKNVREEEPDFYLKQIVLELLRTRKGRQAEPGRKRR